MKPNFGVLLLLDRHENGSLRVNMVELWTVTSKSTPKSPLIKTYSRNLGLRLNLLKIYYCLNTG